MCADYRKIGLTIFAGWLMLIWPQTGQARFIDAANGVRPAGMGQAFVSLADDANAVLFNPAGVASIPYLEISGMYSALYLNANAELYDNQKDTFGYSFLSAVVPAGDLGGIGFAWLRFDSLVYKENTLALTLAHSFSIAELFSNTLTADVGVTGKTLQWDITENEFVDAFRDLYPSLEKWGYTGDAGLLLRWGNNVRLGLVVENARPVDMGLNETENVAPIYRAGVAYCWRWENSFLDSVQPTCEISLRDSIYLPKIGAESLFFKRSMALRAGLNYDEATAGLGYQYQWQDQPFYLQIDYAFSYPFKITDTLGSHRLGMTFYYDPVLAKTLILKDADNAKTAAANKAELKKKSDQIDKLDRYSSFAYGIHEQAADVYNRAAMRAESEVDLEIANYFKIIWNSAKTVDTHACAILNHTLDQAWLAKESIEKIKAGDKEQYEKIQATLSQIQDRVKKIPTGGVESMETKAGAISQSIPSLVAGKALEEAKIQLQQLRQQTEETRLVLNVVQSLLPGLGTTANNGRMHAEEDQLGELVAKFASASAAIHDLSDSIQKISIYIEGRLRLYEELGRAAAAAENFPVNSTQKIVLACETSLLMNFTTITQAQAWTKKLLDYLESKSSVKIALKKYNAKEEMLADFSAGKIDFVLTGRSESKRFYQQGSGVPAVVCKIYDREYQLECLFVRNDPALTACEQLKGMRLGFLHPDSIAKLKQNMGFDPTDFSELKQFKDPKSAIFSLQLQEIDAIVGGEYIEDIYKILEANGVKFTKGMKKIGTAQYQISNTPLFERTLLKKSKLQAVQQVVDSLTSAQKDPEGKQLLEYFHLDELLPASGF